MTGVPNCSPKIPGFVIVKVSDVEPASPMEAAPKALAMLGGVATVKFAVAVDDDIDVFNEDQVLWAMATRFQADADMFVVPKVFCNRLDPSSVDGMSAKLGIDATAPLKWDVERTTLPAEAVAWAEAIIKRRN